MTLLVVAHEQVLEFALGFNGAFQVVGVGEQVSDFGVQQASVPGLRVVGGHFTGEVEQVVDRDRFQRHTGHLLAADGVSVDQPVFRADVTGESLVGSHEAAAHQFGVLAARVDGFVSLAAAFDDSGLAGVEVFFVQEHGTLRHLVQGVPDLVAFSEGDVGLGCGFPAIAKGLEAFFVGVSFERAADDMRDVVFFAAELDLAFECSCVADGTVGADVAEQGEVDAGQSVAVDRRFHDELVFEFVRSDLEGWHAGRRVGALDHSAVVDDVLGFIGIENVELVFVVHVGLGGVGDSEQAWESAAGVFERESDAALLLVVGEAFEDFGVREHVEELRGESLVAVVGTEAGPEAVGGFDDLIVDRHAEHASLFGFDVDDFESVDPGFAVVDGSSHCISSVKGD